MGVKVLIVDDEFLIRLVLADALGDAGFDVEEASTADEVMSGVTATSAPALMVTDIQMPGTLDGADLARHMRAIFPNLPVIYTSGRADSRVALGQMGNNDRFIPKPYVPTQVIEAIRSLLENANWSGREDSNLRP